MHMWGSLAYMCRTSNSRDGLQVCAAQTQSLAKTSFLSKTRKIPLGVPDKMHRTVRRGSKPDPKCDCSLSQITGPKMDDQGVEPKMVRLSDCLETQPSSSCKRLRWKQPDPMRQAERVNACKRSQPQNGTSKRPRLDGQIGRGNLMATVVARNPNLARKFPHLHDRPPEPPMLAAVNTPT